MANLTIKQVKTRSELMDFINFPWQIYKNDPNWVPPLRLQMKEKLNRKKNPFLNMLSWTSFWPDEEGR